MRRIAFFFIVFISFLILSRTTVFAQENNHTAREEAEGKVVWEKLQNKEISCDELSDNDFGVLGEYFMGQSIGNTERHAAMNQMMSRMMGEEGEEQMHVVIGKRISGCDTSVQVPSQGVGFMPMMWMMGGGDTTMMGYGWNNTMGWGGFGFFGWLIMLLFWAFIILGVIALIRYLARSGQGKGDKTPLDILKERYAKGEVNKKEFEEKKKDL